jgi:hypothetical protein
MPKRKETVDGFPVFTVEDLIDVKCPMCRSGFMADDDIVQEWKTSRKSDGSFVYHKECVRRVKEGWRPTKKQPFCTPPKRK